MNKHIAFLIGLTAILFNTTVLGAYGQQYGYGPPHGRWVCNHYTRECYRVYREDSWYAYKRYEARRHLPKKRIAPEPKFILMEPPEKIETGNIINVNLAHGTWGAYDTEGKLVHSGHVSGGKSFCPDINKKCRTVTGTFTVYDKKGGNCKSKIFPVGKGGAPMPYCMFFHEGFALHGSNAVPNYNASHGCVRMSPADAQWLNENFVNVGSTRVKVTYDKMEPPEEKVSLESEMAPQEKQIKLESEKKPQEKQVSLESETKE